MMAIIEKRLNKVGNFSSSASLPYRLIRRIGDFRTVLLTPTVFDEGNIEFNPVLHSSEEALIAEAKGPYHC